jgi:hypothetical protein
MEVQTTIQSRARVHANGVASGVQKVRNKGWMVSFQKKNQAGEWLEPSHSGFQVEGLTYYAQEDKF